MIVMPSAVSAISVTLNVLRRRPEMRDFTNGCKKFRFVLFWFCVCVCVAQVNIWAGVPVSPPTEARASLWVSLSVVVHLTALRRDLLPHQKFSLG